MSDFPLIKRLGLDVRHGAYAQDKANIQCEVVRADELEKLLENATSVRSYGELVEWYVRPFSKYDQCADEHRSFQAFLVGIKPILQDTPESLLRELVERFDNLTTESEKPRMKVRELVGRARKVLIK